MTSSIILRMFRLSPFESLLKPSVCYWSTSSSTILRENVNVENWILVMMRARLRARSTGAARGQDTPLDGELWQKPRDGGGRVVRERPNVRFSEALCSLGLVRYVDNHVRWHVE